MWIVACYRNGARLTNLLLLWTPLEYHRYASLRGIDQGKQFFPMKM
jgi:hypothetical protein